MNDQTETSAIFEALCARAEAVRRPRTVSPFIEAGQVAAAIRTDRGNIYTGVCMDTASSLGMCAERAAVAAMITGGEHRVTHLAVLMPDGRPGLPCGACRELLMQLSSDSGGIRILTDREKGSWVTLAELTPDWWGTGRFESLDKTERSHENE